MIDMLLEALSPGRSRRIETTTIRREAEREAERAQDKFTETVIRYRVNGKAVPLRRKEDRCEDDTVPGVTGTGD